MANRFDYVRYDDESLKSQEVMKEKVMALEKRIEVYVPNGRSKEYALKALEECYMWIGKGIRDDQLERVLIKGTDS